MELKNGFKLIYEKAGKLFASKTGIPAETDEEISFGVSEQEIKDFKLFYETKDEFKGSVDLIPSEDDVTLVVEAAGEVVLGDEVAVTDEELPEIPEETVTEEPVEEVVEDATEEEVVEA